MATYTNLSILQGWLEIEAMNTVITAHSQVPVIQGWIYTTDEEGLESVLDERHPVIISGKPAEAILDITRKLNDQYPLVAGISMVHMPDERIDQPEILIRKGRPYVIAQGRLLTHEGRSCVDIKHISFLGLPFGALEALRGVNAGEKGRVVHRLSMR
jgi:hypothetical protein